MAVKEEHRPILNLDLPDLADNTEVFWHCNALPLLIWLMYDSNIRFAFSVVLLLKKAVKALP